MKISSKDRAYLRKEAHAMEPIIHVGKNGVSPDIIISITEAIEKRELIKVNVLKNCFEEPKDIAEVIAGRTHSLVVQVMGRRITLYKQTKEKDKRQYLIKDVN